MFRHHTAHTAGCNHARVALEFLLHVQNDTGQRTHIAAYRTRLHGLHGRAADGLLGACDIDARQLGRLHKQRFHRDLDTREDGTAQICAVLVDAVKGNRRADVHDDQRRAVLLDGRHRIDQSIHTDFTRVCVMIYDARGHIGADNHGLERKILADRIGQRIHHRRHNRRDDDCGGVLGLIALKVIILQNHHTNLVRSRRGIGRNTEGTAQFLSLK